MERRYNKQDGSLLTKVIQCYQNKKYEEVIELTNELPYDESVLYNLLNKRYNALYCLGQNNKAINAALLTLQLELSENQYCETIEALGKNYQWMAQSDYKSEKILYQYYIKLAQQNFLILMEQNFYQQFYGLNCLGDIYLAINELNQAQEYYEESILNNSQDFWAFKGLAQINLEKRNIPLSRHYLDNWEYLINNSEQLTEYYKQKYLNELQQFQLQIKQSE